MWMHQELNLGPFTRKIFMSVWKRQNCTETFFFGEFVITRFIRFKLFLLRKKKKKKKKKTRPRT